VATYDPKFKGRKISELPSGSTGLEIKTAEQQLNEMVDAGIEITEGDAFMRKIPTYSFPKVCQPLDFLSIKNQMNKGSCAGHTLAFIGEGCFWVMSNGQVKRFSGDAMYKLAQEKDGIRGDRGSTPTACAWVAQNIGLVPEDLFGPTVERYDQIPQVTDKHREAAGNYKLKSVVRLTSYEQIRSFLGAGAGFIQCCSIWPGHFDQGGKAPIDSFFGPQRNDQHGGGHSYGLGGYNADGHILLINSWDEVWRDDGAALMTKNCFDEMFTNKMTFVLGYSDIDLKNEDKGGEDKIFVPRRIPIDINDWI
jgi:hypothetical protein